MAKSERRKKNADEQSIDLRKFLDAKDNFILSCDKVFDHFDWGCKWSDIPVGILDKMQDNYEHMAASKSQKEKGYVSSTLEGHAQDIWKTTTYSGSYRTDTSG